jgi:hypothetical protein
MKSLLAVPLALLAWVPALPATTAPEASAAVLACIGCVQVDTGGSIATKHLTPSGSCWIPFLNLYTGFDSQYDTPGESDGCVNYKPGNNCPCCACVITGGAAGKATIKVRIKTIESDPADYDCGDSSLVVSCGSRLGAYSVFGEYKASDNSTSGQCLLRSNANEAKVHLTMSGVVDNCDIDYNLENGEGTTNAWAWYCYSDEETVCGNFETYTATGQVEADNLCGNTEYSGTASTTLTVTLGDCTGVQ